MLIEAKRKITGVVTGRVISSAATPTGVVRSGSRLVSLITEALERYHHFYGDTLQVECPTGSGRVMNLRQVALELNSRMARIFLPDASGRRPCHGDDTRFATDPHWRDLVLFHEYFHGETGRGLGATHQTGWTALAIANIADIVRHRNSAGSS
jgi:hypothetical protein